MKKAIAVYFLSASAALAHEGHEAAATRGEVHWLTSPDHLAMLVLAGMIVRGLVAWLCGLRLSGRTGEHGHG